MAEIVSASGMEKALVLKVFLSDSEKNEPLSGCSRVLRQVSACCQIIGKHAELDEQSYLFVGCM